MGLKQVFSKIIMELLSFVFQSAKYKYQKKKMQCIIKCTVKDVCCKSLYLL